MSEILIFVYFFGIAFNLGVIIDPIKRDIEIWKTTGAEPPEIATNILSTAMFLLIWPFTYAYYFYREYAGCIREKILFAVKSVKRSFQ